MRIEFHFSGDNQTDNRMISDSVAEIEQLLRALQSIGARHASLQLDANMYRSAPPQATIPHPGGF